MGIDDITSPRKDPRNDLGGPVRNGNQHPGQGHSSQGQVGHPTATGELKAVLGELPDPAEEIPEDSETAAARAKARVVFESKMTDDVRGRMLDAMIKRAENGDVSAWKALTAYDLGLPTAPSRGHRGEPLTGATIGKSIERLLEQQRKDGVSTELVDRLWANDLAEHDDDGPDGS